MKNYYFMPVTAVNSERFVFGVELYATIIVSFLMETMITIGLFL